MINHNEKHVQIKLTAFDICIYIWYQLQFAVPVGTHRHRLIIIFDVFASLCVIDTFHLDGRDFEKQASQTIEKGRWAGVMKLFRSLSFVCTANKPHDFYHWYDVQKGTSSLCQLHIFILLLLFVFFFDSFMQRETHTQIPFPSKTEKAEKNDPIDYVKLWPPVSVCSV